MLTTTDVAIGDHTLHVSNTGEGANPAVLWLHGSAPGANARSNWQRTITVLADDYERGRRTGSEVHERPARRGRRPVAP